VESNTQGKGPGGKGKGKGKEMGKKLERKGKAAIIGERKANASHGSWGVAFSSPSLPPSCLLLSPPLSPPILVDFATSPIDQDNFKTITDNLG